MNSSPLALRATQFCRLAGCAILIVACSDDGALPPAIGGSGGGGGGSSAGSGGAIAGGGSSMGGAAGMTMAGAGGTPTFTFDSVVLFPFDFGAVGAYGWSVDPLTAGSVALVDEDRDPANTTRGALRFNAVFPDYDSAGFSQPVTAIHQFGDPTTGTNQTLRGASRLHFWIRLVSPSPAPSLNFFQPFIQGGAMTFYSNNFGYFTGNVLSDNAWHEFVLEIAGAGFVADVWRIGVALAPSDRSPLLAADAGVLDAGQPPSDAGDAGDAGSSNPSAAPVPVTIDIDYVWIE